MEDSPIKELLGTCVSVATSPDITGEEGKTQTFTVSNISICICVSRSFCVIKTHTTSDPAVASVVQPKRLKDCVTSLRNVRITGDIFHHLTVLCSHAHPLCYSSDNKETDVTASQSFGHHVTVLLQFRETFSQLRLTTLHPLKIFRVLMSTNQDTTGFYYHLQNVHIVNMYI